MHFELSQHKQASIEPDTAHFCLGLMSKLMVPIQVGYQMWIVGDDELSNLLDSDGGDRLHFNQ